MVSVEGMCIGDFASQSLFLPCLLRISESSSDCSGDIACSTTLVCGGAGANCADNDDSLCDGSLICIANECSQRSAIFGDCDDGDNADCANGLDCFSGVCLGADGTPCSENDECINTCISSNCTSFSSLSAACDDTEDCNGPGLACSNGLCLLEDTHSCNNNTECINVCIDSICGPQSGNGDECDLGETADCAAPSECFGTVCLLGDGQACSSNAECYNVCINSVCNVAAGVSGTCDETSDCDGEELVCTASACLVSNGNPCANNADCVHVCIEDLCVLPSVVEGNCDAGDNDDCNAPAVCSATACLYEAGTSCSSNSQCIEECISGTCQPASTLGGPCDSGDDLDCSLPLVCYREQCLKPNGQACNNNDECVRVCIENICSDVEGMGEPCDEEADCQGFIDCGEDDLCGGPGASCTPNNDTLCNTQLGAEVCIFNKCDGLKPISGLCQEDADCEGSIGCSSGTCGSAGASCVSNTDCNSAASLTCVGQTCLPIAGLGGQCDAHDPDDCVDNIDCGNGGVCGGSGAGEFVSQFSRETHQLYLTFYSYNLVDCGLNNDNLCQSTLICFDTTCETPRSNTKACFENEDCNSKACVNGFCAPILGLGWPCDDPDDCGSAGTIDCSSGLCGGAGAACAPNDDAVCLQGMVCISDVCTQKGVLAGSCEDDSDCASGRCITGICSNSADIGDVCDSDIDCGGLLACSSQSSTCGGFEAECVNNRDDLCAPPLVCLEDECGSLISNGNSCAENKDCVSSACIGGVCSNPNGVDSPCDPFDSQDCNSPIECSETTCGGSGATCVDDNDSLCGSGLKCIDGNCRSPSALNGPCDAANSDCASPLVCIYDKCVNPSAVSGPCDPSDGNSDCQDPLACAPQGICGGAGSDCGQDNDALCAANLVCVLDVCALPVGNGGSCAENDDCVNVCVGGTCRPVGNAGDDCDQMDDCGSGTSCSGGVCGGPNADCASNNDQLCAPSLVCLPGDLCGVPLLDTAVCDENSDCDSRLTCLKGQCSDLSLLDSDCDVGDNADCEDDSVNCSPSGQCGGEGAVCSGNDDAYCGSDLACVQGECKPLQGNGGSCGENLDCITDSTCINGLCSDPASPGEPCDAGDAADCSGSSSCGDASQPICGGSGSSCAGGGSDSADDALCVGGLVCVNLVCHGTQANGGSCDTNSDCESGVCVSDTCKDAGTAGEACDLADGNVDCDPAYGCGEDGVCGGNDADCSNNDDAQCFEDRKCIAGHCNHPVANGAQCDTSNDECISGHCINSACSEAASVGEQCDFGDDSDCEGEIGCGTDLVCGGAGSGGCGNDDSQCNTGLICSFDTCAPAVAVGSACDADNSDCASNHCINGICTAVPSSVGGVCDVGDPSDCNGNVDCGSDSVCGGFLSDCAVNDDSLCDASVGFVCVFDRCQNRVAFNGDCDSDNRDCEEGFTCISSSCSVYSAMGGPCDDAGDCFDSGVDCSPSRKCGGIGAACGNDDSLCASSNICVQGSCHVPVGRGGACGENKDCVSGICVFGTCKLAGSVSEDCDDNLDCRDELECGLDDEICGGEGAGCADNQDTSCAGSNVCVNGTCQPPQDSGRSCQENKDCSSSVCIDMSCQEEASSIGQACDTGEDSDCESGYSCGTDGICGGNGAACSGNADSYCESPRVCALGVCVQLQPNGSLCSEPEDCCCQGRCIEGTCSPPSQVDGPCQEPDDCVGAISCAQSGTCGGVGAGCNSSIVCSPSLFCHNGHCSWPLPDGAVCDNDSDCSSGACIESKCLPPSNKGGKCDSEDNNDCSGDVGCGSDNVCGSVYAPCNDNNALCTENLVCAGGLCSEIVQNGGVCEQDSDCQSTNCEDGICAADTSIGDLCENSNQCLGDIQCFGGQCGGAGATVRHLAWYL